MPTNPAVEGAALPKLSLREVHFVKTNSRRLPRLG